MIRTRILTETRTRPQTLHWQIHWTVIRVLPGGEAVYARIIRPALDRRHFRALRFQGLDARDQPIVELEFPIDWDEHARQLTACPTFTVPSGWREEISPELRLAVEEFERDVAERDLRITAVIRIRADVLPDELVDLPRVKPQRLMGGRRMLNVAVKGLRELHIVLSSADDFEVREGAEPWS